MPMLAMNKLLQLARHTNAALGCFSVYNLETIQAVVAAAEAESAPVMLSIGNEAIAHAGLAPLGRAALAAARNAAVPVCVHLNHGRSLDRILQALDLGFHSVMFDGSNMPFEENVQHTRRAEQLAHEADAVIEGELGPITGPVPGTGTATITELAHRFVQNTHVDVLALSIPKGGVEDLDTLRSLSLSLGVPIAIHGASRLGPDGASLVTAMGAQKVNFHSEVKEAFSQGLAAAESSALAGLAAGREAVKQLVRQKLAGMGASNTVDHDRPRQGGHLSLNELHH